MSYDIDLVLPACTHCGRDQVTVHATNITCNVSPIVDAVLLGAGAGEGRPDSAALSADDLRYSWRRLYGWSGKEAAPIFNRARQILHEQKDTFKTMEPPNGWGSVEGVAEVLEELQCACEKYPNATIRVSW